MSANWPNRTLFHGDNLPFLRAMNSESVDLIATDPPFNKGRDFHATPDSLAAGAKFQDRWSWERDVHEEWTDQITDDYPRLMEAIESARYAHSDGMGAYMCFMAVRLLAMRRVLKPTGSIYLHCDPTASHYLKAVMDAIYGWRSFRNEVIWQRRYGSFSRVHESKAFGASTDTVLFYSKTDKPTFNPQYSFDDPAYQAYVKRTFRHKDASGRVYRIADLANPAPRPNLMYEYKGYPHPKNGWAISREKMEKWDAEERLEFPKRPGGRIQRRRFLDELKGKPVQNLWTDVDMISSRSDERVGYPTQKPIPLYERIIKASSNEGDVVLDPFAGCATTCVAAERLQRQWVGIDIWDKAHETVVARLEKETGLFGEVSYVTELPTRTDGGDFAAPFLRVKERVAEPDGPRWPRAKMYEFLLEQHGPKCQGCDRTFDDSRYLELDHNTPRSDGGLNHISNRILLCGPCNRLKSNTYTLSGLRRENKKREYMR